MRYQTLIALLAGTAFASPVPQDFDWNAIDDLDSIPNPDIPVVNAAAEATHISYAPAPAASSVSSAVLADPTDSTLKVRDVNNAGCSVQPASDDTAENWAATPSFSNVAAGAGTPSGYFQAYATQTGSSEGIYGYMGYDVLSSYDTNKCATNCNKITGCSSFNIYYERDPSVDPSDSCSNPASTTVIKCVYYGGPVTLASATNVGQWRRDFHVLIAGSNGYTNKSIATPKGYNGAVALGNGAINAPNDCNGKNTYMGVKIFTSGPFDAGLCAAACSAQSTYNLAHPPKNGVAQTCQFFNTYVLYNGSVAVGQYCSLYNETWPATYAVNKGQWRGNDHFTVGYSFSFSNSTGGADQPKGCTNKASP